MKRKITTIIFAFLSLFLIHGQTLSRFTMSTNQQIGSKFSFTVNYGSELTVDWGDGTLTNYFSIGDSITGTLKGSTVIVNGYDISSLQCSNQQLTTINVSELTNLITLACHNNNLSTLDISKNTKLQKLNCGYNNLQVLTLNTNTALTNLIVNNNNISTLTLTNNILLSSLICNDNKLTSLTLTPLTALKTLWCQNNQLTTLNTSANILLETLICYNNQITDLNVSGLTALTNLWCDTNKISDLNASTNTALKYLSADNNTIGTFSIASTVKMESLYLNNNNLGFNSLPSTNSITTGYKYAPQNLMKISDSYVNSIDLSSQLATINKVNTNATYKWFNGNTELVVSDDYTENNGVFTFKKPFNAIHCEISSTLFPELSKITTTNTAVNIVAGLNPVEGINNLQIAVDNGKLVLTATMPQDVRIYNISGILVQSIENLSGREEITLKKGVYIVNKTKVVL